MHSNGGNLNTPSSNLDTLEENRHHNSNERRVPGNEARVDDMATQTGPIAIPAMPSVEISDETILSLSNERKG